MHVGAGALEGSLAGMARAEVAIRTRLRNCILMVDVEGWIDEGVEAGKVIWNNSEEVGCLVADEEKSMLGGLTYNSRAD